MKTEDEVKGQIEAYNHTLMTSNNMEEVIRTQGILWALKWVTTDEEEKEEDNPNSEDESS